MNDLVGPGEESNSCTGVASVVPECRDAAARIVGQEFNVVKRAAAAGKAREVAVPVLLVFVTVAELDMSVTEGR